MISVLIIGAGAVGSYLGAMLTKAGAKVDFIARGRQLEAFRRSGLLVVGPRGDYHLQHPSVLKSTRDLKHVPDVCFLTVKTYDVAAAIADLCHDVLSRTMLVTLQNGVTGAQAAAESLAESMRATLTIVPGLAYVSSIVDEPGQIRYTSAMSSIVSGRFPGRAELEHSLAGVMQDAGIPLIVESNIERALWKKFLSLATNAALTCLARSPAGIVYNDPDLLTLAAQSIAEIANVARAEGMEITADDQADALALLRSFPAAMYASMYHDLMSGKRLEVNDLSGEIVRRAQRHGIKTPVHSIAWSCLKPFANGIKLSPKAEEV
jgi:2-dehydropantoate 2-reductase